MMLYCSAMLPVLSIRQAGKVNEDENIFGFLHSSCWWQLFFVSLRCLVNVPTVSNFSNHYNSAWVHFWNILFVSNK